jgi:hypothetical protein
VVVPTGRFGPKAREVCAKAVRATALRLSEFYGFARPSDLTVQGSAGETF